MSNWLIGSGGMAKEYALVLQGLGASFKVIGRGENSAAHFKNATGKFVQAGGLVDALASEKAPANAIIAVGIDQLFPVAASLIKAGTKRVMIEKPGALCLQEIKELNGLAEQRGTSVVIAYNRRFYSSVQLARDYIAEDGGVLSAHFEFTEWSHEIAPLIKGDGVKERWLLGNSTHVIDLAFHLIGRPVDWRCWHAGLIDWHPAAARFAGAGVTDRNVMFSYLADWEAPGRWGIELLTAKRRLILKPMEQLQFTRLGSVKVELIDSSDILDLDYKPGLYRQTRAFLSGDDSLFCSLNEQTKNFSIYSEMAGYL